MLSLALSVELSIALGVALSGEPNIALSKALPRVELSLARSLACSLALTAPAPESCTVLMAFTAHL